MSASSWTALLLLVAFPIALTSSDGRCQFKDPTAELVTPEVDVSGLAAFINNVALQKNGLNLDQTEALAYTAAEADPLSAYAWSRLSMILFQTSHLWQAFVAATIAKRLDPQNVHTEMIWAKVAELEKYGDITSKEVQDARARLQHFDKHTPIADLKKGIAAHILLPNSLSQSEKVDDGIRTLPTGQVAQLFATPLEIINLGCDVGETEPLEFCKNLATFALDDFMNFSSAGGETVMAAQDAIHAHFDNQMRAYNGAGKVTAFKAGTGNSKLAQLSEFRRLKHYIDAAATRYASRHGVRLQPPLSREVMGWTAVSQSGSNHSAHVHEDASLAVVFYAAVPPGSGSLSFQDPRRVLDGPEGVPFLGHWASYKPKLGDIVMFPGWLTHKIGTTITMSEQPRVAFAFNIRGFWQDTMPLS